jgi:hypothetical protein
MPSNGQTATCVNGSCVYAAAPCPPGFTSCNGECVDTTTDPEHCGMCGHACPTPSNGLTVCSQSQCQACPPGALSCGAACIDGERDPKNCGACNSPCAANEECVGSMCVALGPSFLVTGYQNISDLKVDATDIYIVDSMASTVSKIPKNGGAPTNLLLGAMKPMHLALDANYVYVTSYLGGAILRIPKGGGATDLIAGASQPNQIVVDAANVYWTNDADSSVNSAPVAGGNATFLDLTSDPHILMQTASTLFYPKKDPVQLSRRNIVAMPKAGGFILPRVGCDFGFYSAAADDNDAYVLCFAGGSGFIAHGSTINPSPLTSVTWSDVGHLINLAPQGPMLLDGGDIYFNTQVGPLEVHRCLNAFAANLVGYAKAVAMDYDAAYVYWTDGTNIGRTAK